MGWQKKSYNISGAGPHTLKWVYIKDGSEDEGYDCGWVDCVQWTGSPPIKYPDPADWDTITYGYDPAGRRIKKTVDDKYTTKYVYDGGNVIAEYDYNNNLLRKYIYGPWEWWQPQASPEKAGRAWGWMKEIVVDNDAEYYYHFDGLGSVVALSDSDGDTVQTYEYSIYGQVASSDPNFLTNPYLFNGRRFDIETGLYYYRARYYNPHIGRFMQTDPVGYSAGMNIYAYCGNNPVGRVDPSGLWDLNIKIPIDMIVNINKVDSTNAKAWVESWLTEVGFFDEYENSSVVGVDIIDGDLFDVDLAGPDDMCDVDLKIPDFKFYSRDDMSPGKTIHYATLNGIGLLTNRILNQIIRNTVHEINHWDSAPFSGIYSDIFLKPFQGILQLPYIMEKCFSDIRHPFLSIGIQEWRYKGQKYDKSALNYIQQGHAMHHIGVSSKRGQGYVWLHKLTKGHATIPPDTLYWFLKGWNEYPMRQYWQ